MAKKDYDLRQIYSVKVSGGKVEFDVAESETEVTMRFLDRGGKHVPEMTLDKGDWEKVADMRWRLSLKTPQDKVVEAMADE